MPKFQSSPIPSFICKACRYRASLRAQRWRLSSTSVTTRQWSSNGTNTTKSSSSPGFYPSPAQNSSRFYARISDRSLIRLHGPDVVHFLDGLLPCRLQPRPKDGSAPIFTAFLTAKGRILHDVFVYPPRQADHEETWYIDVDEHSAIALISHLKKHKLRSKFKMERVDPKDGGVYYIWPMLDRDVQKSDGEIGGQDPRPLMGTRVLSFANDKSSAFEALNDSATELSLRDYTIHRMLTGHAEGAVELISGSALPQESNLDFSGGIDFHKGCYLGQELTIRTHHTGVVRKRILPCQILGEGHDVPDNQSVPIFDATADIPQPIVGTNISKVRGSGGRAGRSTGKWLGGVGNIGLALCRLEMMTDLQLTAENTGHDSSDQFSVIWEDGETDSDGKAAVRQVRLKPFIPDWLRSSIQAGITARSERSTRKRQEAEAENEVDED